MIRSYLIFSSRAWHLEGGRHKNTLGGSFIHSLLSNGKGVVGGEGNDSHEAGPSLSRAGGTMVPSSCPASPPGMRVAFLPFLPPPLLTCGCPGSSSPLGRRRTPGALWCPRRPWLGRRARPRPGGPGASCGACRTCSCNPPKIHE